MAQQDGKATDTPGYGAFESRDDLTACGDNALLLFVAQLRLGFDDVDAFASNSLTDGSNDKKCDLVAVSADKQRVSWPRATSLLRSRWVRRRPTRRAT